MDRRAVIGALLTSATAAACTLASRGEAPTEAASAASSVSAGGAHASGGGAGGASSVATGQGGSSVVQASASTGDAASSPAASSAAAQSSSTGVQGGAIACGAATCAVPLETCCVRQGAVPSFSCELAAQACPNGGTSMPCDDSSDCAVGICCGVYDGNGAYESVGCKAQCDPPGNEGAAGDFPICNYPNGACPGAMQLCKPEPALGPAIGYCHK